MRPTRGAAASMAVVVTAIATLACGRGATMDGPSSATERAARRAYYGAPPVVPHAPLGMACESCHDGGGVAVPGLGVAPPSPHRLTTGLDAIARCEQCHVFRRTRETFVASEFVGLAQHLRRGGRLGPGAPPTIPHRVFMREQCLACHDGPAAREEIRTSHPERTRCLQCHVPVVTTTEFGIPPPA